MTQAYDYIIVGAGSAGCVLANRLSENSNITVCLVEAGPEDWNPFIHIPFALIAVLRSTLLNWGFWTEPQEKLAGRKMFWPRGRMIGGSSSMNAQVYIRGHQADYDDWAALGNKGWGWKDVLPLFRSLEDNERGTSQYHGVGGPLRVSETRSRNVLCEAMVEAAKESGYPTNDDFNGEQQTGFGWYQLTQKDGRRWSSADAFLKPVRHRPNLTVISSARATRVLLEGRRAVGIAYHQNRDDYELRAKREVILSGGTINSPHLLMLSGIGSRAELEQQGIAVQKDLPGVGKNLLDHLDICPVFHSPSRKTYGLTLNPLPLFKAIYDYLRRKTGMLTSNFAEAGGFLCSKPGLERPDLQFHFMPIPVKDHGQTLLFGHGYAVHVCNLRPKSAGRIGLKSANPLDDPLIDPNFLAAEEDMEVLLAGYQITHKILAAKAFDPYRGEAWIPETAPTSAGEMRDAIRQYAETVYHPVGSCKMGVDEMAVVDPQLRVHGIEGLRVADASIMPTLIGGNTNATSIMIGEKAARMILAAAKDSAPASTMRAA